MCNRLRSPGPGPRSVPAAASAASGAAASGRSRWDSRSAFPRVSPARSAAAFSLVGRRPASGRGLDVYADQTLAHLSEGSRGGVPTNSGGSLNWRLRVRRGWSRSPLAPPPGTALTGGLALPYGLLRCCFRHPLHPVARQALLASLDEGWADPARLYREGRKARMLLDASREAAAEAVGCRPDEVVFTPSGTRAVHSGIAGALAGRRRVGRHLIVSSVEHSSVLHSAEVCEADGGSVTRVAVSRTGAVDPAGYAEALRADTALACLQSANHEVGDRAAGGRGGRGVPGGRGAAAGGRGAVAGLGTGRGATGSLLTASAHKWGGPSGVGLLVVRKGVRFAAQGRWTSASRAGRPGSRTSRRSWRPWPRCARYGPRRTRRRYGCGS